MKKIILVISLVCVLFLLGCAKENSEEVSDKGNEIVTPNGTESLEQGLYITFKYTDLESLKADGVVPEIVDDGKYYEIGQIKLSDKVYDVKYIKEKTSVDYYEGEFFEEKLVFFDGESKIKNFILKTENGLDDYSEEISIFKDKYIVTISDNGAGDSLQSLNIYDKNLDMVHVKYIDGTEDSLYINKLGQLRLHKGYENCYLINNDDITYIRTEDSAEMGSEKVTIKVKETDSGLGAEILERTKDGAKPYAGRIF